MAKLLDSHPKLWARLPNWIAYCNACRPHSTLAKRTPDEAYEANRIGYSETGGLTTARTKLTLAVKLSEGRVLPHFAWFVTGEH